MAKYTERYTVTALDPSGNRYNSEFSRLTPAKHAADAAVSEGCRIVMIQQNKKGGWTRYVGPDAGSREAALKVNPELNFPFRYGDRVIRIPSDAAPKGVPGTVNGYRDQSGDNVVRFEVKWDNNITTLHPAGELAFLKPLWLVEYYTLHPQTRDPGWDIRFAWVRATDNTEAKAKVAAADPDYDEAILVTTQIAKCDLWLSANAPAPLEIE